MTRFGAFAVSAMIAAFAAARPACGQDFSGSVTVPLDGVINYEAPPKEDPIARLQAKLAKGGVKLRFDKKHGYLPAVLEALDVPVWSQMLVFSKTSLQFRRISPTTPRAVYFNDDVYIGWVPGGEVVEVSSVDPERGGMFYSLDQDPVDKPRFLRRDDCLQCHASPKTAGVPGHLVRSVFPDPEGFPITRTTSYVSDHRSPWEERFGGWYVTGTHGKARHMGNVRAPSEAQPDAIDRSAGANITSLERFFDPKVYLSPHSDIAALMVLSHQANGHNLIARANYEIRAALESQRAISEALKEPPGQLSDINRRRIDRSVEILLKYMLFCDEPAFPSPVSGTSAFAAEFPKRGPKDSQGRSLRMLDLNRRLFRYPLSYLVYTEAFDRLPEIARRRFRERLSAILDAARPEPGYTHLTAEDRKAIREILQETKPQLIADRIAASN